AIVGMARLPPQRRSVSAGIGRRRQGRNRCLQAAGAYGARTIAELTAEAAAEMGVADEAEAVGDLGDVALLGRIVEENVNRFQAARPDVGGNPAERPEAAVEYGAGQPEIAADAVRREIGGYE